MSTKHKGDEKVARLFHSHIWNPYSEEAATEQIR
jgi:hypothetical protein